jgi:hypothetical protein
MHFGDLRTSAWRSVGSSGGSHEKMRRVLRYYYS